MDSKSNETQTTLSNIPRTGRIGRFVKILEGQVDDKSLRSIVENSDNYNSLTSERKAQWWKEAVERMENELGKEKAVCVMTACGAKCCGQGQRKTAKKLMNESNSIEALLDKLSVYEVKDGELEYKLIDDKTIIARHNRCFCGQVKYATQLHKTDTYCQCSVEFNRQFFMAALDKPVDVRLSKSILNGDDVCEFIISI